MEWIERQLAKRHRREQERAESQQAEAAEMARIEASLPTIWGELSHALRSSVTAYNAANVKLATFGERSPHSLVVTLDCRKVEIGVEGKIISSTHDQTPDDSSFVYVSAGSHSEFRLQSPIDRVEVVDSSGRAVDIEFICEEILSPVLFPDMDDNKPDKNLDISPDRG